MKINNRLESIKKEKWDRVCVKVGLDIFVSFYFIVYAFSMHFSVLVLGGLFLILTIFNMAG